MSERDPMVNFRAPEDLTESIETIAEREDISKSEAWRQVAKEGLANLGGDLQHVADRQQLEQIKEEEHTKQRRAWFRHNVGSHLLKCWNGGLTPEEAADATHGYRREAQEMHEDDALLSYLEEGLRVYQAAYPDNGARLSTWLKSRGQNTDGESVEIEDTGSVSDGTIEAEPAPEHPTMTVEEAAEEFAAFDWDPEAIDRGDVENVDGSAAEVREQLREIQEGDADE